MVQNQSTKIVLFLLGLWQCIAVWTFQFQWEDFIPGIVIILFCTRRIIPALVGVWLQFSPLLFWVNQANYINDTLVGVLVIAFSLIFVKNGEEEPSIPSGWSYNPSSFAARLPVAILTLACWFISRYLAAYQLGYIDSVWDPFFHTEAVLTSSVSKAFPVSDAGLGALVYTLEFLSTCMGGKARWRSSVWKVVIFGLLVIPAGIVSIILVILQPTVVGNWCTLCLAQAACMLLAIPFAIDEVVATLRRKKGGIEDKRKHTWKDAFHGLSVPWYRLLVIPVGIYLMTLSSSYDPILGALSVVVTVLSIAKHIRKIRWFNIIIAILLLILAWTLQDHVVEHTIAAVLIGLLSIR